MEINLDRTGGADERCLEALAHQSRRTVLSTLCEADAPLTLTELADELERRRSPDRNDATGDDEIELYHRHVPKLADVGLVEYDDDRRTVSLAPEFDDADDPTELIAA